MAGEVEARAVRADRWLLRWMGGEAYVDFLRGEYGRAGGLFAQEARWLDAARCFRRAAKLGVEIDDEVCVAEAYALADARPAAERLKMFKSIRRLVRAAHPGLEAVAGILRPEECAELEAWLSPADRAGLVGVMRAAGAEGGAEFVDGSVAEWRRALPQVDQIVFRGASTARLRADGAEWLEGILGRPAVPE